MLRPAGNGGWAGSIGFGEMANMVREGYATAGTDTGHTGFTGSFLIGHPEKAIDFGYRAYHEMTVAAKAIITGDPTQVDLPRNQRSGLEKAVRILQNIEGIAHIQLDEEDVVRHKLVKAIIKAYDKERENETENAYHR